MFIDTSDFARVCASTGSPAHPTTVDDEKFSTYILARFTRKEDHRSFEIVRLSPSTCQKQKYGLVEFSIVFSNQSIDPPPPPPLRSPGEGEGEGERKLLEAKKKWGCVKAKNECGFCINCPLWRRDASSVMAVGKGEYRVERKRERKTPRAFVRGRA